MTLTIASLQSMCFTNLSSNFKPTLGIVMYLSQLNRFHIEVTIVLPELSYLPSYSRAVSDTTILYTSGMNP